MRIRTLAVAVAVATLAAGGIAVAQEYRSDFVNDATGTQTVWVMDGADRYETAALVAEQSIPEPWWGYDVLYIANGQAPVDALPAAVGAPQTAKLLYVTADGVPAPTLRVLRQSRVNKVVFLGGEAVIPTEVRQTVVDAIDELGL